MDELNYRIRGWIQPFDVSGRPVSMKNSTGYSSITIFKPLSQYAARIILLISNIMIETFMNERSSCIDYRVMIILLDDGNYNIIICESYSNDIEDGLTIHKRSEPYIKYVDEINHFKAINNNVVFSMFNIEFNCEPGEIMHPMWDTRGLSLSKFIHMIWAGQVEGISIPNVPYPEKIIEKLIDIETLQRMHNTDYDSYTDQEPESDEDSDNDSEYNV